MVNVQIKTVSALVSGLKLENETGYCRRGHKLNIVGVCCGYKWHCLQSVSLCEILSVQSSCVWHSALKEEVTAM